MITHLGNFVFGFLLGLDAAISATNSLLVAIPLGNFLLNGTVKVELEIIGPILPHESLGSGVVDIVDGS
jgi:hypothetical protein